MALFNRIGIVGVGLIGGSLGLVSRKKKLAREVVGVSRHAATLVLAKKRGAIDRGSQDLSILSGVDFVVFATPVGTILKLAPQVASIVAGQTVVTDAGSTKVEVAAALEKVFPNYVGSHPLAGGEKRGVVNADAGLFENSLCIITPNFRTDLPVREKVSGFWKAVGSRVVSMPAAAHDKMLASISHLPHAVAFSLINSLPQSFLSFAPAGLKDTTRIAASDSTMWRDIFLSNSREILAAIKLFKKNLVVLESAIRRKDHLTLANLIARAGRNRGKLDTVKKW